MPDTGTPITGDLNAERDFEPGARVFVWAVWTAAFVALIIYAAFFTINIPWADEWSHASVIAGERPISVAWLWEPHNEHRLVLPKLIWIESLRLSHYNFRLLPFVDIFALAGLAFVMVLEAKRLRGWVAYTDAFFPLLILNPAQFENLVWSWQVGFVLPVVITGAFLLPIIRNATSGSLQTWKPAALACAGLVLLPFCGVVGLAFGVALSLWFDYLAFLHWRSAKGSGRRRGRLFLAGGFFVPVVTFFSIHRLSRPPQIPPSPGVRASLITSLQFLSGSFGTSTGRLGWPLLGLAVLSLVAIGMVALLLVWWRRERERSSAAGLFMLLAATIGLALAIGHGRSGLGEWAGMTPRYVTITIPGFCALYFTWQIFITQPLRRFLQVSLFTLLYLVLPLNVQEALTFGRTHIAQMNAFEKDLRAGSPPWLLAERHEPLLDQPQEVTTTFMPMLHRAGIGLFRYLKDSPPVSRVALPVTPVAVNAMEWHDGTGAVSGPSSYLLFALSKPEFVSAIRLQCAYIPASPDSLAVFYGRRGQNGLAGSERGVHLELGPDPANQALTVPVDDTIDEFRIQPGTTTSVFKLSGLALLLPDRVAGERLPDYFGGSLDFANAQQIAGWAWNKQHSNSPIQVDLYDGDSPLATVLAGDFRQDLLDAHIGRGAHAFSYPVRVKDGKVHIVRALISGTQVELAGSPRTFLASPAPAESPDAKNVEMIAAGPAPKSANVEGSLDVGDLSRVAGWAWDKSRPDVPIMIDILDGDSVLARIPADLFRQDLLEAHKGRGTHAFSYTPKFASSNYGTHTVRAVVSGTKIELDGSPKTITVKK